MKSIHLLTSIGIAKGIIIKLPVAWLLVLGYRFLVIGSWLLVLDYWLSGIGYRVLIIGSGWLYEL